MPTARRERDDIYWQSECGRVVIYVGDCRDVMPKLTHSFHSIVTDAPYELGFMGKRWDSTGVAYDPRTWSAVERLAIPGAHLLAFGGTRTYHRMVCAIEDAGFDVRDTIAWVYGCLSEDTEILTDNGWRTYKDVKVGDTVAAWNSDTEAIVLEKVEKVTVAPYNGDMIKFKNDNTDQLLTPNHRVYKKHAIRFQSDGMRIRAFEGDWNVKQAESINRYQPIKLPLAGYHDGLGVGGTDYAELLGWVWSEGGFDNQGTGVRITQSSVNADKVDMIIRCLEANGIDAKHYTRERLYKDRLYTEHTWFFSGEPAIKMRVSLPGKHPTWSLLWAMTLDEKRAMFNSAMLGDGSGMAFFQKDDADREWFQALLHCIGMQGRDNPRKLCVSCHDNMQTELQSRHLRDARQHYTGSVWCVSVPSKAFLARRNGKVFITGNSGFPKSHDISKAIDKSAGAEREIVGRRTDRAATPKEDIRGGRLIGGVNGAYDGSAITTPATDAAKQWDGWGTALKPALEPIVLARKPFTGTVAENTLSHGCGGLNIDGCRVPAEKQTGWSGNGGGGNTWNETNCGLRKYREWNPVDGRWPANLIHDGSPEVTELFPAQAGGGGADRERAPAVRSGSALNLNRAGAVFANGVGHGDSGIAARFFYSPKANSTDRAHTGTAHPTVKPLDLMRYLVRLVTVRGGIVLDPFMGSGSTGVACIIEGMHFVGIEQSEEYAKVAVDRLKEVLGEHPTIHRSPVTGKRTIKDTLPPPQRLD